MNARRNLQVRKRRRQKLQLSDKLLKQQEQIRQLIGGVRKDSAVARKAVGK